MANRRSHAAGLGATALDPAQALPMIMDKTKGAGVPRVFEASGAKAAVELAIKIAGRGSTASFIGLPQPDVQLPMLKVLFKDITIRAGVASVIDQWPHLIPLSTRQAQSRRSVLSHNGFIGRGRSLPLFDAREDNVVKIMMNV